MLKVKEYLNDEEYNADPLQYDHENDCPIETDNFVAIVNRQNDFGDCKGADACIICAKATTAVKRFFKAIDSVTDYFDGWEEGILESMESGEFSENEMESAGWAWEIENLDDKVWYVSIIA